MGLLLDMYKSVMLLKTYIEARECMKRRVWMCEDTKAMLNKKVWVSCMGKVC
jgi:hypothetical protein